MENCTEHRDMKMDDAGLSQRSLTARAFSGVGIGLLLFALGTVSTTSSSFAEPQDTGQGGFGSSSRSEHRDQEIDVDTVNSDATSQANPRGRMDHTKWGTVSAGDKFGSVNFDALEKNVGAVVGAIGDEIKRSTAGSADDAAEQEGSPSEDAGHGTAEIDTNSDLP